MSDREPTGLYIYQAEPAYEKFAVAIGGPCFDPIRRARFATREEAQDVLAEVERLRAMRDVIVEGNKRLGHFAGMAGDRDEGSLFVLLSDAATVIQEAAEAAGGES